jgi:thymidylate synthase (FAD)
VSARIVATTQPAPWLVERGVKTAEQLIVYTARVSSPHNQDNHNTGGNLLRYCIKHGHWSVFETASMTVEIETTRAIAAQLLRHRSFTFQEFSLRYARSTGRAVVPSVRLQDEKNRQSSLPNPDEALDAWWVAEAGRVMDDAEEIYRRAIEKGVAKEVARFVLPLATPDRIYMTGSVRSWIHYLQTRLDLATQVEHRLVAEDVARVFAEEFPVVSEACGVREKEVDGPVEQA